MRPRVLLVVLAGAGLLVGLEALPFYTDWLWFEEVGYVAVFLKLAALKAGLLIGAGLTAYVFLAANLRAAVRARPPDVFWELEEPMGLPSRVVLEPFLQRLLTPVVALLALALGLG